MSVSFDEYLNSLPDAPWKDTIDAPIGSHNDDQNNETLTMESYPQPDPTPPPVVDCEPISKYLLVSNLKSTTKRKSIEALFSKYGIIRKITINKDSKGIPDSTAIVHFAIAPFSSNFGGKHLVLDNQLIETEFITMDDDADMTPASTFKKKATTKPTFCKIQHVSIGTLTRPTIYQEMWRASRLGRLTVNTQYQTCQIGFQHLGVMFKLDFPWSSLSKEITMETTPQGTASLTISLRHPPRLWEEQFDHESARNIWRRSTELYMDLPPLQEDGSRSPLSLLYPVDQVNLGSWTDYRLELLAKDVASEEFEYIVRHLMNHGILQHTLIYQRSTAITVVPGKRRKPFYNHTERTNALDHKLLYMLECAITNRCLNQYTLDAAFYDRLKQLDVSIGCKILLLIISENTMKYNALAAFQSAWQRMKSTSLFTEPTVPDGYCMISSALVTPTSLILQSPAMESTNRTLRHYSTYSDRFLRVTFVEDDLSSVTRTLPRDIIHRSQHKHGATIHRIRGVLDNGIKIGEWHYDFLAFDSTQLSYHSCWFFASLPDLSAVDILKTMVDIDSLTSLEQYIAATDICFQPNRPVPILEDTQPQQEPSEEEQQKPQKRGNKKGGRWQRPSQQETKQLAQQKKPDDKTIDWIDDCYNLSNNVRYVPGKIAPKYVRDIMQPLELSSAPSAVQYSLGGCLGVLAVSNYIGNKTTKVQIRPSHYVFNKTPNQLEIVQSSSYAPAFLDRTLITLLSSLGVSGHIFLTMMQHSMAMMNSSFSDSATAMEYLKTFTSDDHAGIPIMRKMISAGLLTRHDPFLLNMLWIFRTRRLIEMKKNAALHVSKGAKLMVIMDETNTLEPGEVFCQISDLQSGQLSKRKRITGTCFVVRQPCIHSGDIRLFEAVDKPNLRHLCDVIVVSSKQNDDVPRQHVDGKMDGRRFTIIWDWNLQPYSKLARTLNNREPKDKPSSSIMTPARTIKSFIKYLRNDNKDTLLRHYMLTTDKLGYNILDSTCIKLALRYADATDYTSMPCSIDIDPDLESSSYPDYMEIPGVASYPSNDIQGQLYRTISPSLYQKYTDQMILKNSDRINYDPRFKLDGMEPFIIEARDLKNKYSHDIKSLMGQYGINTEAELISGEIVDVSRLRLMEDKGSLRARMIQAKDALLRHYRHLFDEEFIAKTDDPSLGPILIQKEDPVDVMTRKEIKAAAWYYVTYHPHERKSNDILVFSFPWLLIDLLEPVAQRQLHATDDTPLDQDAIEKYRTQPQDMPWIDMDDDDDDDLDYEDDDESNDSDDDHEDGDDYGAEESEEENDLDENGQPLIHVDARTWTSSYPPQTTTSDNDQNGVLDDALDDVPIINIKLSDIAGI